MIPPYFTRKEHGITLPIKYLEIFEKSLFSIISKNYQNGLRSPPLTKLRAPGGTGDNLNEKCYNSVLSSSIIRLVSVLKCRPLGHYQAVAVVVTLM